jgi:membrane-associated progesterone receptor component
VFDVTRGKNFYGPDGPYGCFAGRDATIGLSRSDLKVFEGLKAGQVQEDPRELIEKLTKEERQTVNEWVSSGEIRLPML